MYLKTIWNVVSLRTVFVKILKPLSLSLSADLCIHSYWLSQLKQASHRKMIQSSTLRLWRSKILTCPLPHTSQLLSKMQPKCHALVLCHAALGFLARTSPFWCKKTIFENEEDHLNDHTWMWFWGTFNWIFVVIAYLKMKNTLWFSWLKLVILL